MSTNDLSGGVSKGPVGSSDSSNGPSLSSSENSGNGSTNAPRNQAGPTGSMENTTWNSKPMDFIMTDLFGVCSKVIEKYMDNSDLYKLNLTESNLVSEHNVPDDILIKEFDRYKKCYYASNPQVKKDMHLILFTNVLKNEQVYMTRLGNDNWIKSSQVKLMFGANLGKTSQMVMHLSQIYRLALVIKSYHEKRITEYPEIYKPDENLKFPTLILLHCFKMFQLTPVNSDPERAKAIIGIITELSSKLGIRSGFNTGALKDSLNPVFAVGADLLNRAQAKQGGSAAPNIQPGQISNIFDKVLNNDGMQKMLDSLKNAAQNNSGPPDLGQLVGNLFQSVNPEEIMNTLRDATKSEIPDMEKRMGEPSNKSPETVPDKKVENKVEETTETTEIIEEIIEEVIED